MTIEDAQSLLSAANFAAPGPQKWADLGCGSGLFGRVLARGLPDGSHILCLDKSRQTWDEPNVQGVRIDFRQVDFVRESIPGTDLDGILMANSLHYVPDKTALIQKLRGHLSARGRFLIVEYDTERRNPWVPYPIPFRTLEVLFSALGFARIRKIGERESIYGPGGMYAAEIEGR